MKYTSNLLSVLLITKTVVLLFSLSKLSQLQDLDMSHNKLETESISVIGDMTSLIKLSLSSCGLREVPHRLVRKAIKNRNIFFDKSFIKFFFSYYDNDNNKTS